MPAVSERQRRFMGAELGRAKAGKKTHTGMSISQLEDFVRKPIKKKKRKHTSHDERVRREIAGED